MAPSAPTKVRIAPAARAGGTSHKSSISTLSGTNRPRVAGRVLTMPVTVVQQDWGAALGYDAAALWRPWAPDLDVYRSNTRLSG